jgi:hypothetical protein
MKHKWIILFFSDQYFVDFFQQLAISGSVHAQWVSSVMKPSLNLHPAQIMEPTGILLVLALLRNVLHAHVDIYVLLMRLSHR